LPNQLPPFEYHPKTKKSDGKENKEKPHGPLW
jgi:hypothetical protein